MPCDLGAAEAGEPVAGRRARLPAVGSPARLARPFAWTRPRARSRPFPKGTIVGCDHRGAGHHGSHRAAGTYLGPFPDNISLARRQDQLAPGERPAEGSVCHPAGCACSREPSSCPAGAASGRYPGARDGRARNRRQMCAPRRAGCGPAFGARLSVLAVPGDVGTGLAAIRD